MALPPDLAPPPYAEGTTLLNLMASLVRGRGGAAPHPPLSALDPARLRPLRHLVLLLVDGLGARQIPALAAAGALRDRLSRPDAVLATVFPATTATAVATVMSAASPAEHAVLGWHLNLPRLGLVATVLLGLTRTGTPALPPERTLGQILRVPSHLDRMAAERTLVAPPPIPDSAFSRAVGRWHRRLAAASLDELVEAVDAACRGPGPGYCYAYWPGYDSLCHTHGPFAEPALAHLREIEAAVERLAARLRGRGVGLVVSADHGMIDTPPQARIDLSAVPGLYGCLATLPAGDPRAVACFVRPRREAAFLAIVREHLAPACHCIPGEALLAAGALGPGAPHPELGARLGDYLLVARGGHALFAPAAGEGRDFPAGNHGGMSPEEMEIPLYLLGDL
ncbi:alkaline phosphatase family protein [Inmirania thermothiophila]|uniref:Putative AlkP superfamily pyrophosphatase or phosphodiesterase n=1 Tax=Inmirania thermothiophila TaxID=1750597 RepID=A0A3N1Y644_9GAMM|nr:alkaline phosphatase family protein [Inmirania thermothiophila]ROR32777.1 putative AlkP superfamily pyrophosphatase or phosphodiesterase [Inmirania thermothiophila]